MKSMKILRYIAKRILILIPQIILISLVTFILMRMIPGDPAVMQLGPWATDEALEALRDKMHLNDPILTQYFVYMSQILQGDFGRSWVTGNPVIVDLATRIPATLELILISVLVMLIVMIPLGAITARPGKTRWRGITNIINRITFVYGLLAGALPDFWLGLLLIFFFFVTWPIAPAPVGRLAIGILPPAAVTGFYTIDSLIAGDMTKFVSAARHLVLPVITLAFVNGGAIYKQTRAAMATALRSDYSRYTEGLGIKPRKIFGFAFRNAAPPVIVVSGVTLGYLLGGAVLIETIFNNNGVGQYAVQSVLSADYAPIQGFVIFAAVFTMIVYTLVDLIHYAMDPRIRS